MRDGRNNVSSLAGTRRLADAVRQAKVAAAQRSDVVVDIREADRARLEILLDALQGLVAELEPGDDFFDFTLSGGTHPRLWIDGTGSVLMARDRRTYRLVRETRLGRITLGETSEVGEMADKVTDYVAERIVERDKAYAADELWASASSRERGERAADTAEPLRRPGHAPESSEEGGAVRRLLVAACLLMFGVVLGAGGLMALAASRGLEIF